MINKKLTTQVKYGNKNVKFGEELTPTQVKDMPDLDFKHEDGALYTIIMIGKYRKPTKKTTMQKLPSTTT